MTSKRQVTLEGTCDGQAEGGSFAVDGPPAPQPFDFSAFSSIEKQEDGYDMPVLKPDKTPSGMVIRLLGPNSTKRATARRSRMNRRMARAGKTPLVTAELAEGQQMDDAVTATVGWSFPEGFVGPEFNEENVRMLYDRHTDIFYQVLEGMDDLKNFTKASPKD